MKIDELSELVDAVIHKRQLRGMRPHQLVESIHRKRFQADYLSTIEPLLHIDDNVTYKQAIDIIGKMKGASDEAAEAIEKTWRRTWVNGVPQACDEAFRALLRIGGNEDRLLLMIQESMPVDNYAIHKQCAETLMKMENGRELLSNWTDTPAGRCDCHLHRKLSEKIKRYMTSDT